MTDLPYRKVLDQIAEFAGMKINVLGTIPGNLQYIHLNNTTAENAVDAITQAAGASWYKTDKGNILVFRRDIMAQQGLKSQNPAPMRLMPPTTELPPSTWQPFQFQGRTFYHVPLQ